MSISCILRAARGAGGEGGAVSKDAAVLLLLLVGEPGAGRGVAAQLIAVRLVWNRIDLTNTFTWSTLNLAFQRGCHSCSFNINRLAITESQTELDMIFPGHKSGSFHLCALK